MHVLVYAYRRAGGKEVVTVIAPPPGQVGQAAGQPAAPATAIDASIQQPLSLCCAWMDWRSLHPSHVVKSGSACALAPSHPQDVPPTVTVGRGTTQPTVDLAAGVYVRGLAARMLPPQAARRPGVGSRGACTLYNNQHANTLACHYLCTQLPWGYRSCGGYRSCTVAVP